MKAASICIFALALSACATTGTSDRKIVRVEHPALTPTSTVSFNTPEAQAACETRKMRKRALDDDLSNDLAQITVLRELRPGARTMTDVDVNCRDYFASRLRGGQVIPATSRTITQAQPVTPQAPIIVNRVTEPAPQQLIEVRSAPVDLRDRVRVRRGDTLYGIARRHCTGWKTLARENGLSDASLIQPGDVLYLPADSC